MSQGERLFDISPALSPDIAVFPGDTPLTREVLLQVEDGDPVTLSTLRTTVHVGAHIDGPNHYTADATGVTSWPLERCIGPCQVLHVKAASDGRIGPASVTNAGISHQRVLFATDSYPDPTHFNTDFVALHPDTVDALHECGVTLVGIDTPSVDPASSTTLAAHARFREHSMTILEGLVLSDVPAGVYELIALPLNLVGFDASPVRAILRTLPNTP
jgi:arylformamidase